MWRRWSSFARVEPAAAGNEGPVLENNVAAVAPAELAAQASGRTSPPLAAQASGRMSRVHPTGELVSPPMTPDDEGSVPFEILSKCLSERNDFPASPLQKLALIGSITPDASGMLSRQAWHDALFSRQDTHVEDFPSGSECESTVELDRAATAAFEARDEGALRKAEASIWKEAKKIERSRRNAESSLAAERHAKREKEMSQEVAEMRAPSSSPGRKHQLMISRRAILAFAICALLILGPVGVAVG